MKILTDSVASLPPELAEVHDIHIISLFVNHEGREYIDAQMDVDEFYAGIAEMADNLPTSSQPSQLEFENFFEQAAEEDEEVLGIFISSEMSGTFSGAVRAARAVAARRINLRYSLIDSTSNSFDEAFPVLAAADARDKGLDLRACTKQALRSIAASRFLFTPETLTFLQRGGRIGGAAALLGNLIQICPVLTVADGKAESFAKLRTRKKALRAIEEKLREDARRCGLKNAVVHYIGSKKPAEKWAREVVDEIVGREVAVLPVSPVIGTHVGPAVGVAYECRRPLPGKLTTLKPTVVHS